MEHNIPLVVLPSNVNDEGSLKEGARRVSEALQTSGFLLVKSDLFPLELQRRAIHVAGVILNELKSKSTIEHPTDPKKYIMIESLEDLGTLNADDEQLGVLQNYWEVLEQVKHQVLNCISLGLGLPAEYFMSFHNNHNSCLRLLHYPGLKDAADPTSSTDDDGKTLTIRCKAHSDYGSVTLLSTDGVGGLQALIDDRWTDVPHVEGALVVNIGSLLSDWTKGKLLATLHRVVSTNNSCVPRTSIAFFADPDKDISTTLEDNKETLEMGKLDGDLTVAEYIQWRSGGVDRNRNGLAFTNAEEKRAEKGDKG
eukprot:scaffold23834_cov132-Cylindrotheca_fusiformis.AAC.9